MRILTDNLKAVQKIWSQVRVKGVPFNDYVYLNFQDGLIEFQNESTVIKAKLHLEDNDGSGTDHRSMFIDGSKFFSLVQFYEYIDIDSNDVFYSSLGDKFIIPELNDDVFFPDMELDDWETIKIEFTPELNKKLSTALSYIDADPKSEFRALFIHQGTLISCNRFKILIAKTDNGLDEVETSIPAELLKLIISLDMQGTVDFKTRKTSNDAMMMELSYGDLWLRFVSSSMFVLPFDPESEDFISTYDHPTYFAVDLSQLDEATRLLMSYYSDTVDALCKCSFETDDPDAMYMVIHLSYEASGATDYRVKLISCSDPGYFTDKTVCVYLSHIRAAIGVLGQYGVTDMRITYDDEASGMAFQDAKEEAPVFVIHTVVEAD